MIRLQVLDPNNTNLGTASFQPHFRSPECDRIKPEAAVYQPKKQDGGQADRQQQCAGGGPAPVVANFSEDAGFGRLFDRKRQLLIFPSLQQQIRRIMRHSYFYHRATEIQRGIGKFVKPQALYRPLLSKWLSGRYLFKTSVSLCLCGYILALTLLAQVPSPKSVLGFQPTDDKTIADWNQITDYFGKLDKASNRVLVQEFGKSTLGKPMIVAFISAPSNIKNLEKLRRISQKLADPRTVAEASELEGLIREGKTIV